MWVKLAALAFSAALLGCASKITSEFVPYTVELKSGDTFREDLGACRGYALHYLIKKGGLDVSQIAQEAATEGSSKLGYMVLSPFAPALGALGAASAETLTQLGLNSQEAKKIIATCMHDKGLKHGMYHTLDPNL